MTDTPELRIDPTAPTTRVWPAAPGDARPAGPRRGRPEPEPAVSTAGELRPAYAQYVIDPHTHAVSVRVRDAATNEVISQIPSAEVEAMNKALREYAEALARRHAAAQAKASA